MTRRSGLTSPHPPPDRFRPAHPFLDSSRAATYPYARPASRAPRDQRWRFPRHYLDLPNDLRYADVLRRVDLRFPRHDEPKAWADTHMWWLGGRASVDCHTVEVARLVGQPGAPGAQLRRCGWRLGPQVAVEQRGGVL